MDSSHRVRAIISFVSAVDSGSFAAAARTLGVTSAAVSKNVATLEASLGVRLLNRTTRTLNLTNEGTVFIRQARVALEALDAAVDAVAAQRAEPLGRVRISTSMAFGREQLMPMLPGLLKKHTGLAVVVDFDDRIVDMVRDNYDLALRGGNIRDSALISRPVCQLNTVLVASPDYLSQQSVPLSVEQLRQHRLIARRFLSGSTDNWNFKTGDGRIMTFDPSDVAVLTLSSPEAIVDAACEGVGIAQAAVHLVWEHLISGRLKVIFHQEHHPGNYEMVIQYPHRALIAPRVKVVVDYLLNEFATKSSLHVPLSNLKEFAL
ncbi:LysR family transcriptional regulator [Rosenbergiella nectarea]|uniref:LysR family transcriptional regulator n=1 Tax=Rosenbergiella nectarea TaxID=988801 RepID=UPI001F4D7DB0|nr:LysR family transcriptional regulator [Rosenbergiella nectarea]